MNSHSDLLPALQELKPEAISRVHDLYFAELYRYARYRLGDSRQAEDAASEAFLRLLEALHEGTGPRENLRGWLLRTTSNIVNDLFRKQYRHPHEPLPDPLRGERGQPHDSALRLEQSEELRAAISELTQEQQDVLALRFGSGFSLKETAQRLGKRVPAVKSLQYRAVSSLRELLEADQS